MDAREEIKKIGLKNVAIKLDITLNTLSERIENPYLFTLHNLNTLQNEFGFTNKMIVDILKSDN